jgi:hypothetical protein
MNVPTWPGDDVLSKNSERPTKRTLNTLLIRRNGSGIRRAASEQSRQSVIGNQVPASFSI